MSAANPHLNLENFLEKFFFIGQEISLEFGYLAAAKGSMLAHYLQ